MPGHRNRGLLRKDRRVARGWRANRSTWALDYRLPHCRRRSPDLRRPDSTAPRRGTRGRNDSPVQSVLRMHAGAYFARHGMDVAMVGTTVSNICSRQCVSAVAAGGTTGANRGLPPRVRECARRRCSVTASAFSVPGRRLPLIEFNNIPDCCRPGTCSRQGIRAHKTYGARGA